MSSLSTRRRRARGPFTSLYRNRLFVLPTQPCLDIVPASPATPPRPHIGFRTELTNPFHPSINRNRSCQNSFRTLFAQDPQTPSLRLETIANHPGTPIESQCSKDNTSTRQSPQTRQRHNTAQTTKNKPHPVSTDTECSSENGLSPIGYARLPTRALLFF